MLIEQSLILKGYVIGQNAPAKIMEAMEAIVEHFKASREEVVQHQPAIEIILPPDRPPVATESEANDSDEEPVPKKPRKPWSSAARAAAAERMRARQAAKHKPETTTLGEAQAPSQGGA